MRGLLALSRFIDEINTRVGRVVSWLILIVVVISSINAVFRKAFDMSSNAWLELQWYLFGAIFLLAAGYTLTRNGHVRVDILSSRLSDRGQAVIDVIGVLFFLLPVTIVVLWLSVPMVIESYQHHEVSSNSGGLIRWPVKALIPLGFALLLGAAVSHLIKCVGFLAGRCPSPHRGEGHKTSEELLAEEIAAEANTNLQDEAEGR